MVPEEKNVTKFDNKGNVRVYNRAERRRKPPTNNWYTKATHQIKKIRNVNMKCLQHCA